MGNTITHNVMIETDVEIEIEDIIESLEVEDFIGEKNAIDALIEVFEHIPADEVVETLFNSPQFDKLSYSRFIDGLAKPCVTKFVEQEILEKGTALSFNVENDLKNCDDEKLIEELKKRGFTVSKVF